MRLDTIEYHHIVISTMKMKLFVVFVLLCLAATSYAAPRVIGGEDAPEGKYPYLVSVRFAKRIRGGAHYCGGSILNKRWILTAAHCVMYENPRWLNVVAGTTLLEGGEEKTYHAEYIIWHQNFDDDVLQNDIGLIRVSKDIQFNDKVQPIALPSKGEETYKAGDTALLAGWGSIKLNGPNPIHLQEIELKLFDQAKCEERLSITTNITDAHICTFTKLGEGACHGDSGSPLTVAGVQVGIASFVKPCAKGYPDAFARVHTYLDWIADEQQKFEINHQP